MFCHQNEKHNAIVILCAGEETLYFLFSDCRLLSIVYINENLSDSSRVLSCLVVVTERLAIGIPLWKIIPSVITNVICRSYSWLRIFG